MRPPPGKLRTLLQGIAVAAALTLSTAHGAEPPAAPADGGTVISARTKPVIQGALKYLASKQNFNGSWSAKEGGDSQPVAMTSYVLLAFMATGNLPDEGEYARHVAAGAQYLIDAVKLDGLLAGVSGQSYMYNHSIATIALAELYGESRSPALRAKLERLVGVILKSQNKAGGWRYQPRPSDADLSVSVGQVAALRAALNAGLAVPPEAIERAVAYVGTCHEAATGGFCYQPGRNASFACTAAAIYSLQVCGRYDDPRVAAGAQFLFKGSRLHFTYGHYYAAPAMFMIGGETWRKWNAIIQETLLTAVQRQGDLAFWDLKLDAQAVGPIYCTAVYTHMLALPYNLLPLYQR